MKRSKWLEKKGHAAETIKTVAPVVAEEAVYVLIHDADGRSANGFGRNEEAAFQAAHASYTKARHRASLSVPGVSRG